MEVMACVITPIVTHECYRDSNNFAIQDVYIIVSTPKETHWTKQTKRSLHVDFNLLSLSDDLGCREEPYEGV